jgi:hypothetical protein
MIYIVASGQSLGKPSLECVQSKIDDTAGLSLEFFISIDGAVGCGIDPRVREVSEMANLESSERCFRWSNRDVSDNSSIHRLIVVQWLLSKIDYHGQSLHWIF